MGAKNIITMTKTSCAMKGVSAKLIDQVPFLQILTDLIISTTCHITLANTHRVSHANSSMRLP